MSEPFEIIAEIITTPGRLDEMNILIRTSNRSPLDPQHVLDAVSDLLLIEYGPFMVERTAGFDA